MLKPTSIPWPFVVLTAVIIAIAQTSMPIPASEAGRCADSAAHRALEFRIGTWAIASPSGTSEGTSVIRYDLDRCVVVEEWDGIRDRGRNIDAYNDDDHAWHRLFVDAQGRVHVFEGTGGGASIAYRGTSRDGTGKTELNRLTIRSTGRDGMTEVWRQSLDGGATWRTVFEGRYTRT
jgi:hypothetical protein